MAQQQQDGWLDFIVKGVAALTLLQLVSGAIAAGHTKLLIGVVVTGYVWRRVRQLEARIVHLESRVRDPQSPPPPPPPAGRTPTCGESDCPHCE